jgi:hypothetical protein
MYIPFFGLDPRYYRHCNPCIEPLGSQLALITLAPVRNLALMSRALLHSSGHSCTLPLWLGQLFIKPVQLSMVTWHNGQGSSPIPALLRLRHTPCILLSCIPLSRLRSSGTTPSGYGCLSFPRSSFVIASRTPFHTTGYS